MLDNGFGEKDNSKDFLIRAYYIEPDFKTATGGAGTVAVKDFISFRDHARKIGFPIVNEATADRLLTGSDIDPESMQRAGNGDYWVGDEFGAWILHFDAAGVLLDAPYSARLQLCSNRVDARFYKGRCLINRRARDLGEGSRPCVAPFKAADQARRRRKGTAGPAPGPQRRGRAASR